ncbi:hypothetical protein [Burkholderia pyrrocinia]|uniref:Uncharacterized protein n=1 Tax=Burkholderia pyrrocinia TaxID=60550 RepID=A0ABZ3BBV1_BURPY
MTERIAATTTTGSTSAVRAPLTLPASLARRFERGAALDTQSDAVRAFASRPPLAGAAARLRPLPSPEAMANRMRTVWKVASGTFLQRRVLIHNSDVVIRKIIRIDAFIYPTACSVTDKSGYGAGRIPAVLS